MWSRNVLFSGLALFIFAGMPVNGEFFLEEKTPYILVDKEPPADIKEPIPASPSPDHTWIGGRWFWDHGWSRVPGRWVVRPHPRAEWIGGHWDKRAYGWVWIHGHWG